MTILIISRADFERMLLAYVDQIADEAIAEAKAYSEVQELERIAELR